MINKKNILKEIGVLFLLVILVLQPITVTAKKNPNKRTNSSLGVSNNHEMLRKSFIIWDNNLTYGEGLIACQYEPYYGELGTCADDFILNDTQEARDVHWIGGFWQGDPASFDWQITFYNDDGTGTTPGTVLAGPFLFLNADCNEVFIEQIDGIYFYEWMVYLEEPVTCIGGVKYWVGFQGQGVFPPQSGMAVHTSPQQLNQCKFKSEFYGYPEWTDSYDVFELIFDLAFQLSGLVGDTIPPVTNCTIAGTNPVTITLIATDDDSGVNHTYYKLDAGACIEYTQPVIVTEVGDHVVDYYSVDKAGNQETEKSTSFTVEAPITIIITGGFGVSAIIKNTGTTNLTNIDCKIALDGKLVFVGKTKSYTIENLAAGEEVTVKDFVFGFGTTNITATVGSVTEDVRGKIFLFFIFKLT